MAAEKIGNRDLLPRFVWVIDVPERAEDLAKRWHNVYAKDALREAVEWYHASKQGFAKHYRRDARQRYRHAPRSAKYKRFKSRRYHSAVDQIKTGRSRRRMLKEHILRIGGSATRGTLRATLVLRFPFRGGTGRFRKPTSRQAVTIQQLILELQRFDDQDPAILAAKFKEYYMRKVDRHRATRKRVRIS